MNSRWKYRLYKRYQRFKQHDKWAYCDDETKERIEKQSPGRFDFQRIEKATIATSAIIESDEEE